MAPKASILPPLGIFADLARALFAPCQASGPQPCDQARRDFIGQRLAEDPGSLLSEGGVSAMMGLFPGKV